MLRHDPEDVTEALLACNDDYENGQWEGVVREVSTLMDELGGDCQRDPGGLRILLAAALRVTNAGRLGYVPAVDWDRVADHFLTKFCPDYVHESRQA